MQHCELAAGTVEEKVCERIKGGDSSRSHADTADHISGEVPASDNHRGANRAHQYHRNRTGDESCTTMEYQDDCNGVRGYRRNGSGGIGVATKSSDITAYEGLRKPFGDEHSQDSPNANPN
jgi:hypothetical protein